MTDQNERSLATIHEPQDIAPLSLEAVKERVHLIDQVMRDIMKSGTHYGVIPGTDRPTLLQPGAEKLGLTFRLAPRPFTENKVEDWEQGFFHYDVRCELYAPDGTFVAAGTGSCNSREKRYRNQDPYSIVNTVKKMAYKRAFVGAILKATSASDIFTQDTEDLELDPSADQGHGVCPVHNIALFQKGKMRSPAHQLPDGGWCNKPMAPTPPPAQQPRGAPQSVTEAPPRPPALTTPRPGPTQPTATPEDTAHVPQPGKPWDSTQFWGVVRARSGPQADLDWVEIRLGQKLPTYLKTHTYEQVYEHLLDYDARERAEREEAGG